MSPDRVTETNPARGRRRARREALRILIRAYPGRTAGLAGLSVVAGGLPAVFAALVGRLVDAPGDAAPALAGIAAVLIGVEVADAASSVVWADLSRRFDEYMLARVMGTTLALPGLDAFEDPELAAQTDRAVRIARFGPGELIGGYQTKWRVQATGLASTVLVATVWPVAAVALLPLWVVAGRFLQADMYRANPFWAEPLRRAEYVKRLGLMPDAAKEQRIFGLTGWLVDRFGREWARVMGELWKARAVGYRTMAVLGPILLAVNVLVLVLAARSALDGGISAGTVAVLVQGLLGMAALASQDGDIWIENGAIPVPDVLAHEQATRAWQPSVRGDGEVGKDLPGREIRFEAVTFAYPGRDPVYSSLALSIEAGRSLAIVGLNGAGKTTLAKLLTGLETPQSGRILVDGLDLSTLRLDAWRRQVAAIFQDFVRYELPARDNIGFGSPAVADDALVLAAASRAGADKILADLPDGLDTILSRRYTGGVDLSGGQWQRIALARAMAAVSAGARVLVLDEPTAQLDVRAEADIYRRFLDMTEGLTSIVISHRFSTVRQADRIVVVEHGRVAEDGDHAALLAQGGRYATLFRTQADRYE